MYIPILHYVNSTECCKYRCALVKQSYIFTKHISNLVGIYFYKFFFTYFINVHQVFELFKIMFFFASLTISTQIFLFESKHNNFVTNTTIQQNFKFKYECVLHLLYPCLCHCLATHTHKQCLL